MVVNRCVVAAALPCALVVTAMQAGAQATTGTIVGRTLDSTSQQPLSNVTVSVQGTQRGALTRNDGGFTLGGVPAGTYTVRANRIGYGSQSQQVTVTAGGTATVTFNLRPAATQLTEVVVTGLRHAAPRGDHRRGGHGAGRGGQRRRHLERRTSSSPAASRA
jgi:hypothetical protein